MRVRSQELHTFDFPSEEKWGISSRSALDSRTVLKSSIRMSFVRRAFYHRSMNRVARTLVHPFKSLVPKAFRFPVSGTLTIAVPGHSPLQLSINPTCYLGKVLYWDGIEGFEPGVHRVFKHLVQQAETFLDIGSNIGFYASMAAKYSPQTVVHAFEPLPAAFAYLQTNLKLNSALNAQAHQSALSDASGETTFFFALNPKFYFIEDQLTSTGSLDESQANRTSELRNIDVHLASLDDFVATHNLQSIDLIKMDTEATEHLVLDGARASINRFRPFIICEVLPGKVEMEIQQRIDSLEYAAYRIRPTGIELVSTISHSDAVDNDYLFCPVEKRDEVEPLVGA